MNHFRLFARLLRVEQWYKNLVLFAPLLFAQNVLAFPSLLVGFFGFCAGSSISYIANDWLDRDKDRLHPTKKNRPLASGKISGLQAGLTVLVLAVGLVFCTIQLGSFYAFTVGTYLVLTTAYSLGLKNVPILDLVLIGLNFSLRMMAGLSAFPQKDQWAYFTLLFGLILLFLTHKRRSDIKILGAVQAVKHKPVLRFYTQPLVYALRGAAYLFLFFTAQQLFIKGWSPLKLAAFLILIFTTSLLFTRSPELTIKPHHLLKNKGWDFLVALCLALAILI